MHFLDTNAVIPKNQKYLQNVFVSTGKTTLTANF